jgi:GTP-binding protein
MNDLTADKFFLSGAEFITSVVKIADLPATELPEFAFIGRSNVGKSSIINSVLNRKKLARVSNTPGRTQQLNFFLIAESIHLVDLPGYGYARAAKANIAGWNRLIMEYLRGRRQLKRIFMLIDARHGIKDNDEKMLDFLDNFATVVQIVLTKADKISANELQTRISEVESAITTRAICFNKVIATSSVDKSGITDLREAMFDLR